MKCVIHLKSSKLYLLEIYLKFLINLSKKMNFSLTTQMLPLTISRISLYKSPHVYKKAKDHYEIRQYKALIYLEKVEKIHLLKKFLINKPIELTCKLQILF